MRAVHPPKSPEEDGEAKLPLRAFGKPFEEEKQQAKDAEGGFVLLSDTSSIDRNPFEVCKDSPGHFQALEESGAGGL